MSQRKCSKNKIEVSISFAFLPENEDSSEKPKYWYAACNFGWFGPHRSSRALARKDAKEHEASTRHSSGVLAGA